LSPTPQKHPFANLGRWYWLQKSDLPAPGGMLRGGLCLLLHICYKKLVCYRLLQGLDKSNINEYAVFRDLFDKNKGLITPWSQVQVLVGPPKFY